MKLLYYHKASFILSCINTLLMGIISIYTPYILYIVIVYIIFCIIIYHYTIPKLLIELNNLQYLNYYDNGNIKNIFKSNYELLLYQEKTGISFFLKEMENIRLKIEEYTLKAKNTPSPEIMNKLKLAIEEYNDTIKNIKSFYE